MPLIRNLEAIRSEKVWTDKTGNLVKEAFQDVLQMLKNVGGQTNSALKGAQNHAPPQINALHVDGGAGIYHAYITDNNQSIYRGVEYSVEYSADPAFGAFHMEHLGPSRDKRLNLGHPGPLYFRAYSSYPTSPASPPVYLGGSTPTGVTATGTTAPALRGGQGSGTNPPTLGAGGFGQFPWRGTIPPRRG